MFQAPSPFPSPAVTLLEEAKLAEGVPLLRSGVYGRGGLRMVLQRVPSSEPLAPPLLLNPRVVPLSAGVFTEAARRVDVVNAAGVVDAVLAGRVSSPVGADGKALFLLDVDPERGAAKVHIPGHPSLQELPPLVPFQWLELLLRGAVRPYDGRAEVPAWVERMRMQHVQLLARVRGQRLEWVEPQPAPL